MRSVSTLFDLSGRTALVTGGAGHLGKIIGASLAECGAHVALLDKTDPTPAVNELLSVDGGDHLGLTCDLADEAQVQAALEQANETFGRLDVLVHCAAFVGTDDLEGWTTPVEKQSLETWRQALEVNLTAPFALTQAAIPYLKAHGTGSVIHVASIYGVLGPDWSLYDAADVPGTPAAYGASKGGLVQMTRWLATTLAPDIGSTPLSPAGWNATPRRASKPPMKSARL